jgi:hypothetical protein
MIGGQKMFGSANKISEKLKPDMREKVRGVGSLQGALLKDDKAII